VKNLEMSDKDTSFFEKEEVKATAKENPRHIPKLIKSHFFQLKEDHRRQRFIEHNKPNSLRIQSNEVLPPGATVLFTGCLFASMYVFYMRYSGPLFSWSRYARSQHKKVDPGTHGPTARSRGQQQYTYERVYGQPGVSGGRHGAPRGTSLPNGEMQQWEIDLVRRYLFTLGICPSKLDAERTAKVLCANEIKRAYLKTSLRTHPDMLSRDASEFERNVNSLKFQAAAVAYEELKHVMSRHQGESAAK
jgi:hypothetical protein